MSTSISKNTPNSKIIYIKYKNVFNITEDLLNPQQIKQVLSASIKDYEKGGISIDELSSVGHELFKSVVKIKNIDERLFHVVLSASELSFYSKKKELEKQFNRFLEEVLEFE